MPRKKKRKKKKTSGATAEQKKKYKNRNNVKSPYKDPGFKRNLRQIDRICSVPGCTAKVGKGLRFLCDNHYKHGE